MEKWQRMMNKLEKKKPRRRAMLGKDDGTIEVPGRPDKVYVRVQGRAEAEWEVYNYRVSVGLPHVSVIIQQMENGRDWELWEVERTPYLQSSDGWAGLKLLPSHHEEHEWPQGSPGPDAVNVYLRALEPARTEPKTTYSLSLTVRPYRYSYNSVIQYFPGQTLEAAGYLPPQTYQTRWILSYINPVDNLAYLSPGDIVTYSVDRALIAPPIPSAAITSALVELKGDATAFVEEDFTPMNEVFRVIGDEDDGTGAAAVSGGWPYDNIHTVDTVDSDAEYATITTAISGETGGANAIIEVGTPDQSAVVLNKQFVLRGAGGPQSIQISQSASPYTIDVTNQNASVENMVFICENTGADIAGVRVNTASIGEINLRSVEGRAITGGSAKRAGINCQHGETYLTDCQGLASGGTHAYGVWSDSGIIYLIGGQFSGLAGSTENFDVYADTGATIELRFAQLLNGTIGGAGTVYGYWIDSGGDLYYRTGGVDYLIDGQGGNWPLAGEIRWEGTLYASVSALLTAWDGSGGQALFGEGTFEAEAITEASAADFRGSGMTSTIILADAGTSVGPITFSDALTAYDITFKTDNSNSGTTVRGLVVTGPALLERVRGEGNNSHADANSDGRGIWTLDDSTLVACEALATRVNGTATYGLYIGGSTKTVRVTKGRLSGDDGDLFISSGCTAILEGTTLAHGTIAGTGSWVGRYYDEANDVIVHSDPGNRSPADNAIATNTGGISDSDFVATIATLPGGAVLTYNAPSSGDEENLVPQSTSNLAKMVLHNTTRGDDALISDCNTGTNTITLTDSVPGTWQVGDTITIRSQTNTSTSGSAYFIDFEFTSTITDVEAWFLALWTMQDSGTGARIFLHPYETNSGAKRLAFYNQVAGATIATTLGPLALISKRFCLLWRPSGSNTMTLLQGKLTLVGS